ncbi:MAG TPA: HAD domain-containing protein [Nitrososphaera sp.]|nr:HAD domain-containing protein [Nitrososphaera sp.]
MPTKILFLDIDGVMVLDPHKGKNEGVHGHDPFYKPSVRALNHIISSTKCKIVNSSGWRRFFDFEQIQEIFQWNGVQQVPIGFTQDYDGEEKQVPPGKEIEMIRCREVLSWLRAHDTNGRPSWCAVDDMDLSFGLDKFVRCPDNNSGLSYRGVPENVISILNGTS